MEKAKIRVGVIGGSLNSWGGLAHLSALQALPAFEVTAISTTRRESVNQAAEKFNIPYAFTDSYELIQHSEVDLVSIAVKVPEHEKLALAAFEAGKHVFSEFPLGRNTDEAKIMLKVAEDKSLRHFVGLQARANPSIQYVKDLLAEGYIGKVSAVHVNYTMPFPPGERNHIRQSQTHILNESSGMNMLAIAAGHMLDGINYMYEPISEVSSILETQAKEFQIIETGEKIQATAPDHVVVSGKMKNGAIFNTHFRYGIDANILIEFNGDEGDLILTPKNSLMFQMNSFNIKCTKGAGQVEDLPIPTKYNKIPLDIETGIPYNVAGLYMQIGNDLNSNTNKAPDFHTAVSVHSLLDIVRQASKTELIK
ncbi:Gfo/Idh/MocA family protein [Enterococcus casseliflavus]|uniref:Gfo/Idh/MocA family protein n=1 Tax=Enterococcus casseliflavus TaxID=37734 RepID=UPI0035DA829B